MQEGQPPPARGYGAVADALLGDIRSGRSGTDPEAFTSVLRSAPPPGLAFLESWFS